MAERKVLNKYIPPDFDHSKIPKRKKKKNEKRVIRMMVPMTVRCVKCGTFIYAGKKLNSKKEYCDGEDYLGIKRFRFFMKCGVCSNLFAIKTDPQNSSYVAELGCTENFHARKSQVKEEAAAKKKLEEEEEGDAMKQLENRTLQSKRELDVMDALDELKSINSRLERANPDDALKKLQSKDESIDEANNSIQSSNENENLDDETRKKQQELEDEALIRSISFKRGKIRRIQDESHSQVDDSRKKPKKNNGQNNSFLSFSKCSPKKKLFQVRKISKKNVPRNDGNNQTILIRKPSGNRDPKESTVQTLGIGGYDSSSSDSDEG